MLISTPWHFSRPALADQYLRLLTSGLVQTTTIFAPRRAGKTQFLRRDLPPMLKAWVSQSPMPTFGKLKVLRTDGAPARTGAPVCG